LNYFSAVIFIGFAGKLGWGFGLDALWVAAGNLLFIGLFAWLVPGSRIGMMLQNLNAATIPDFFNERFASKCIKAAAAVLTLLFILPFSASVFKGLGYLQGAAFNIAYGAALLMTFLIICLYLVLDGYFAVTPSEYLQTAAMILGICAVVAVLVAQGGGIADVMSAIRTNYAAHVPIIKRPGWLVLISVIFMTSAGTWMMQQMARKSYMSVLTFVFSALIAFAVYFTGAMSHIFFDQLPVSNGLPAYDRVIPEMLVAHLPMAITAVILLLVVSASMTMLSPLIAVSASSAAGLFKENSPWITRLLTALFVLLSFLIAKYNLSIIVTLMSLSWGVIAGSLMAPYLYGLFWKKTTKAGAAAGMATGGMLAIALFYLLGAERSPLAAAVAMIAPFIIVPAVSMFTIPPKQELLNKAFPPEP
jgi:SSS family solute:Na+ symporter